MTVRICRIKAVELSKPFIDAVVDYLGVDPLHAIIKGGTLQSSSDGTGASSARGGMTGKTQDAILELAEFIIERYSEAEEALISGGNETPSESEIVDELLRLLVPATEVTNDYSLLGFHR